MFLAPPGRLTSATRYHHPGASRRLLGAPSVGRTGGSSVLWRPSGGIIIYKQELKNSLNEPSVEQFSTW